MAQSNMFNKIFIQITQYPRVLLPQLVKFLLIHKQTQYSSVVSNQQYA